MNKFFAVNLVVNYLGEITNQIYTVQTHGEMFLNSRNEIKKNQIIFAVMKKIGMLDKFREDFIVQTFEDNPELKEKFKTIFNNNVFSDSNTEADVFLNILTNNPFLIADFVSENMSCFTFESEDNAWQLEEFKIEEVNAEFVDFHKKLTNEEWHIDF